MVDESTWWSPRRRALALLALALALIAWTLFVGRTNSPYGMTVGELVDSGPGYVKVGAVFAEPPVTSRSGTMFTIADSPDSKVRIDAYYHGTRPLETQWGSKILSGDDLVGHPLVIRGEYDGYLFVVDDIIIKFGGGYME